MPETDKLPPLREVIAQHGLAPKKSLGQNFLFDLNLTRKIARAAGANEGGLFYEVGPGPGGLTRALLSEGADKVIAVERDARCLPALQEIARAWPGKLEIVSADALELDEAAILSPGVRIAANLPYNVGTAILIKWLTGASASKTAPGGTDSKKTGKVLRSDVRPIEKWPPLWASLTLMFQKEVAQRITAQPGGEHYGRLSVLAQWRCTAKILFDDNRGAFVPPPSVTSAIVRLEPRAAPLAPARLADLEKVTACAFGQRRKMLRQSLKPLGGEAFLEKAGIDPTARPEDLTIEQFAALARALN
ncbi:MAG TPA: rRNA adenine dimethyltransferase family protein [Rhizomicrobium sp.]|nr:rRNA adenine dimethyltransferase family protein [Rhizomicrobium sp.]